MIFFFVGAKAIRKKENCSTSIFKRIVVSVAQWNCSLTLIQICFVSIMFVVSTKRLLNQYNMRCTRKIGDDTLNAVACSIIPKFPFFVRQLRELLQYITSISVRPNPFVFTNESFVSHTVKT